jgi:dienelactone hydrolase
LLLFEFDSLLRLVEAPCNDKNMYVYGPNQYPKSEFPANPFTILMKHVQLLGLILLMSSGLFAQSGDYCIEGRFSQIPYFEAQDLVELTDITYGWAPRWPSPVVDTLKMDVYMPDPTLDPLVKRPFVMIIHGGSFISGNKSDVAGICRDFARRGFVAASISYRLGWDCTAFPLFICFQCATQASKLRAAAYRAVQDTRAALRYAAHHADDLGIDPDMFFVGGISAGSVAAINAVYMDQNRANDFCPTCLDDLGPADEGVNDLTAGYQIKGVLNHCGAILEPAAIANAPDVPIISFHDDGDCIVPSDFNWALGCFNCTAFFQAYGSQEIHAYAQSNGTCSELNLRLGSAGHCTFPNSTFVNRSSCFIKKSMCGACGEGLNNDINAVEDCDELGGAVSVDPHPSLSQRMHVYPNPARGLVHFRAVSPYTEVVDIQIHDLQGRLIARQWATDGWDWVCSECPSGMYLYRIVEASGTVQTGRIVLAP